MDTLELSRTFREVAGRGSFSMAAKSLNVSKANVSKYVAALENRLGVRLLNRSSELHRLCRLDSSSYATDLIAALARRIAVAVREGREVWCIFDNTAGNAAAHNTLDLQQALDTQPEMSVRPGKQRKPRQMNGADSASATITRCTAGRASTRCR